jgi:biotin carboxylase
MTIIALEWLTFGLGRLAQAAHARGLEVELLTADPGVYRYELASGDLPGLRVTVLDTFDDEVVATHLAGVTDLQGLISTTDTWSLSSLRLQEHFGLPGPNPAAVTLARNKDQLRNRLFEHGLSSSPGHLFPAGDITRAALLAAIRPPFIVKDTAGTGSRNVWLIRTEDDVTSFLSTVGSADLRGELTAEAFFFGPMYSVETLSWEGQTRVLGTSTRIVPPPPSFREEGNAFPVVFPEADQVRLESWTAQVLDSIEYTNGFSHTEFIVTSDGLEVVEVNARLGGGLVGEAICRSLGQNIYDSFLDLALGKRPALMDTPPICVAAFAEVDLYAPATGTFTGFAGTEMLSRHPGEPTVYPIRVPGDRVISTPDHRGSVGSVFASGASTELAMHNALSAAANLRIMIQPTGSSPG